MKLIGISGKKQHGKDTLASYLIANSKCKRVAHINFADAVYEEAAEHLQKLCYPPFNIRTPLQVIVDYIKEHKDSFRLLLQWIGTDYKRNLFGDDYWINKWMQKVKCTNYEPDLIIVSDVRFLNEAELIKDLGGYLIRVNRLPCCLLEDKHLSENELDDYKNFDSVVINDSTLAHLTDKAKDLVDTYQL